METRAINRNMKISGSDNFKSIFECEKKDKKNKIEKLNKDLSKLDRRILELQDEYANKLFEKNKLIQDLEKRDIKDA